jgi:hypothetical protein
MRTVWARHARAGTLVRMSDSRDVVLGLALVVVDIGTVAGRAALAPARLAARAPRVALLGRRLAADLAHQGELARARLDVHGVSLTVAVSRIVAERVLPSPELDRIVDAAGQSSTRAPSPKKAAVASGFE